MGDRTTVTLTVREKDYIRAKKEGFNFEAEEEDIEEASASGDKISLAHLVYHEVNYGELDFLNTLQEMLIPYDTAWEAGCEYDRGSGHLRFNEDGSTCYAEYYGDDLQNVAIADVISAFEDDRMAEFIEECKRQRFVMSWEVQEPIIEALLAKRADASRSVVKSIIDLIPSELTVSEFALDEIWLAIKNKLESQDFKDALAAVEQHKSVSDMSFQQQRDILDSFARVIGYSTFPCHGDEESYKLNFALSASAYITKIQEKLAA